MKLRWLLLTTLLATPALAADNALVVTPGSGVTMRTIDVGALVQAGTSVPVGVNGASAWGTAGIANANVLTVQGIASMTPFLVTATQSGTWNIGTVTTLSTITNPVAATQSGNWTSRIVGNAGATLDSTVAAGAAPTNMQAVGGQFNSTPITLTNTQASAVQLDANGFLKVNVAAGGASGGTSSNFGSAFPGIGTAIGLTSGTNMIAWSATTNYGTAPAAIAVPAVNAFVTNAATPGRAVSGSSSPVVQSASPTTLHLIAAASTNATSQKASATTLFSCQLSNNSTTIAYFKIYNKASAPTVGTDVPVKTLIIPGPAAGGGGSNVVFGPGGFALSLGFAFAFTTGIADNNSTAVAATTYSVDCDYD